MTQFEITATWQIEDCPVAGKNDLKEPLVALSLEAKPRAIDDGDFAFAINPEALQSLSNVTTFEAKFHENSNMLASINASVEDRTGQIIGGLVKTGGSLLRLTALGRPEGSSDEKPILHCSKEVEGSLKKARTKKAELALAASELRAATQSLASQTAEAASLGFSVSEKVKEELSSARARLSKAQAGVTIATRSFQAAIKPISYKTKRYWPKQSSEFAVGPIVPPETRLRSWLESGTKGPNIIPLYLQIEAATTFGINPTEKAQPIKVDERGLIEGIPYRQPAAGRLVACTANPCKSSDLENVVASFDVSIAQLGVVHTIPFTSRTFGNNNFAVEFAEDGRLKMVKHGQASAPGEVAVGALSSSAGAIADAFDPLERIKRQNEYLAQLRTRADALEALNNETDSSISDETGALNAQAALTQAKIAELQARITLAELTATFEE
jgi:hypothetical protein